MTQFGPSPLPPPSHLMPDIPLSPPYPSLSDSVIRSFIQPNEPVARIGDYRLRLSRSSGDTSGSIAFDGVDVLSNASDQVPPSFRMQSAMPTRSVFDNDRLPPLSSYMNTAQLTRGHNADNQRCNQASAEDIELRRQRNWTHQARYKMKQSNKVVDLENSIEALKGEIQDLKLQRQVISVGVPGSHTRWGVAAEYFRLFRNGIMAPQSISSPNAADSVIPVESPVQRRFLQTTMASVVGVIGYGVDSLIQNWKLISLCHPDIDIQLVRLESGPGDSLIAITRGEYTITENTLRLAFPHLVDVCEDGTCMWDPLAIRLLGRKLVMNGCSQILWDDKAGHVASIQYMADMLKPMLQLLGNLEEVSRVFTNARLNPESMFVVS